jgi:acyl dehydratase
VTVRTLDESPSLGSLYVKVALPSLPGRSRPPSSGLPDLELRLPGTSFDADHLRRYSEVCGFDLRRGVPATYPHVLAFPLHLELMTERTFPFPILGLVHIGNRIEQRRPLDLSDTVELQVRATDLRPHRKGTQLTLVTEALVYGEVVWREETVALRRTQAAGESTPDASTPAVLPSVAPGGPIVWRLDSGLGRRYAAVSADRNPIHLSAVTARAFGFPRPIAHGMWTKAKALATLGHRVPAAFAVEVELRKPIQLPGSVSFGARDREGGIDFGVSSGDDQVTHLVGHLTPL